jgi:hypothetical protein
MKKIKLNISFSELTALREMIRSFQFDESDIEVMAFFILTKVYQRITTRLFTPTNKDIKFSLKLPEAIALKYILNNIYSFSTDMYNRNTSLRIITTINQEIA